MEVPIKRTNWVPKTLDEGIERIMKYLNETPDAAKKELEEGHATSILDFDFEGERRWILGLVESVNSPIVFTHHDPNMNNILIRDEAAEDGSNIILIDNEFSSYSYRGERKIDISF